MSSAVLLSCGRVLKASSSWSLSADLNIYIICVYENNAELKPNLTSLAVLCDGFSEYVPYVLDRQTDVTKREV